MRKKIVITLIVFLVLNASYAQRIFTSPIKKSRKESISSSVPTDTLWGDFINGTPTLYSANGGGYVSGNNGYGDLAKAQAFKVTSPYKVEGVLIWFGAYEFSSGNANSAVSVKLYNMDGSGSSSKGTVACPGTVMASNSLLISDIDTSYSSPNFQMNTVLFSGPQQVAASYAIGIDMQTVAPKDTLGLVTTTDGDADSTEMAWEKWKDGRWFTILHKDAWKLDLDFAIFPIVDLTVGFNEMEYMNGIRLSKPYPNPAKNYTTIQYAVNKESEVVLDIFDIKGKQIVSMNEGKRLAGEYSLKVDLSSFSAGTYFYSLKSNSGRLTMKMIVE